MLIWGSAKLTFMNLHFNAFFWFLPQSQLSGFEQTQWFSDSVGESVWWIRLCIIVRDVRIILFDRGRTSGTIVKILKLKLKFIEIELTHEVMKFKLELSKVQSQRYSFFQLFSIFSCFVARRSTLNYLRKGLGHMDNTNTNTNTHTHWHTHERIWTRCILTS